MDKKVMARKLRSAARDLESGINMSGSSRERWAIEDIRRVARELDPPEPGTRRRGAIGF